MKRPLSTKIQFWITRDRRITQPHIYRALIEGDIHSIYFTPDAAKSAAYPTEKIWAIQINAKLLD